MRNFKRGKKIISCENQYDTTQPKDAYSLRTEHS